MTEPPPRLAHLDALLDGTGIAQHATYAVVAREHGYCLDDNARGLILAVELERCWPELEPVARLRARTAAFVQHAWNGERRVFRNFMSFDRRWLEETGSDDAQGRAVWALGVAASRAARADDRDWAASLLEQAAPALTSLRSPRAIAAGLLGLAAVGGAAWTELADRLAGTLGDHLRDEQRADWCWFEASLSYDNARLPQAMIAAGRAWQRDAWCRAGLDTLDWLCGVQCGAGDRFRPVGTNGFLVRGGTPARFDQQPLEAAATIAACAEAWRLTGEAAWLARARRAHAWFGGDNDLGIALAVPDTGGCRDGLHPDRVNANQGAESTLAWLQADLDLRELRRAGAAFKGGTGRAA